MFSVVPNIVLAPNMTQNAERKHRTQDANTAHNRLHFEDDDSESNISDSKPRQKVGAAHR